MKIQMVVDSKGWYDKRIDIEQWLSENIGVAIEMHQSSRILSERDLEQGLQRRREETLMRFAVLTGNTTPYDYVRIAAGEKWHAISHYNFKERDINLSVDIEDETTAVMFKLKFS